MKAKRQQTTKPSICSCKMSTNSESLCIPPYLRGAIIRKKLFLFAPPTGSKESVATSTRPELEHIFILFEHFHTPCFLTWVHATLVETIIIVAVNKSYIPCTQHPSFAPRDRKTHHSNEILRRGGGRVSGTGPDLISTTRVWGGDRRSCGANDRGALSGGTERARPVWTGHRKPPFRWGRRPLPLWED